MKKAVNYIKIPSLCLAGLIAGSALLSACNALEETTTTTTEETTEAITTTTIATTELTWVTYANPKDSSTYKKLELDGVAENYVTVTDYDYIESEKYVLFLEKDVYLPGDFVVTLDAIVDEIEKEMGVSAVPSKCVGLTVPDMSYYYNNQNPWEGWSIDNKIPIFVCADHEDKRMGCIGNQDYVRICLQDLFTKELYDSLPGYKKYAKKLGYIDYVEITKWLAVHIAYRNYDYYMPGIIAQGVGNYMSYTVPEALAEKFSNISTANKKAYRYDSGVPKAVNAKNAEELFAEDYGINDYTSYYYMKELYGRYFCRFLKEEYGDDFYSRLNAALNEDGETRQFAWIVKKTFGDDVFTKFGDWCVKKKVLQSKQGIFPKRK